ncbi:MAG TPA: DUF4374 domain-containing protein [Polyangiales bacterium]|nr:DUF4374 domain-containing protein [Polyangiales bacterium]
MKFFRTICALASTCAFAACSDTEPQLARAHEGTNPLYLAATGIWDDSATTSYLHVVDSLDRGTQVDASQAREINGAAKLFAYGENRWFAVGGGEEPTITRYTLDKQGRLREGAAISLQPYGVQDLWDALYFVSDDKAYYPDTSGSQLIAWNPRTMEVLGTIPLPETEREGYLSYYSLSAVVRGDKLLFSVGWFDWETNDTVLGETGLVELDTKTDKVSKYEVDERCGGVTQALEAGSGEIYLISSALAAATHRLERLTTDPCALRVPRDKSQFDPGYLVHLADLTGGALAGEPVPVGDDEFLLRVFDEAQAEIEPEAQTWALTGQAAWTWSRWNVRSNELTPIAELPASTADTFWFRIDGDVFASETEPDYSQTTLVNLTAEAGPTRSLTVPGFLQNIARIR